MGFQNAIKLSKIILKVPNDDFRPSSLALFINCPSLDFSDAETMAPAQRFELGAPNESGEIELPVKIVKFIRCPSLQLFFSANEGEDTTKIERIQLLGKVIQAADMNKLEKSG